MPRHPTTLTKLTEVEARLKADAEALAKKRAQLARQREKLERTAQEARWMAAGQVVEKAGLPIGDLGELELCLKLLLPETGTRSRGGPEKPE
jgi:hypothetical protein